MTTTEDAMVTRSWMPNISVSVGFVENHHYEALTDLQENIVQFLKGCIEQNKYLYLDELQIEVNE